jgi:hypothetical protein
VSSQHCSCDALPPGRVSGTHWIGTGPDRDIWAPRTGLAKLFEGACQDADNFGEIFSLWNLSLLTPYLRLFQRRDNASYGSGSGGCPAGPLRSLVQDTRAGGPYLLWTLFRREKSLSLPEIEPWSLDCHVRSPVSVPTELVRSFFFSLYLYIFCNYRIVISVFTLPQLLTNIGTTRQLWNTTFCVYFVSDIVNSLQNIILLIRKPSTFIYKGGIVCIYFTSFVCVSSWFF